MGKLNPISVSFNLPDGREVSIETGKLATQAHGSVVLRIGNTMLFACVVSKEDALPQPWFPLFVDYQEKFAAAGRIPGNFFKREGRLSDHEVLVCRLVDRAIRPLFPEGYMNETQVQINLISGEDEILPDAFAALAASAAIAVSNIPFAGPISEVRVARIDGKFQVNPLKSDLARADVDLMIAATLDNIMMVEGEAKECSEEDLIEGIKIGHDAIKTQCQIQLDLAELVGEKATVKREIAAIEENEEVLKAVKAFTSAGIDKIARGALDKKARGKGLSQLGKDLKEHLLEANGEEWMDENKSFVSRYYEKNKKEIIRELVLSEGMRLDGRKTDEIRDIWSEVDYLPSAHGSAVFNRGETQALVSLTLGTKLDEQMIDNAMSQSYSKFILHYNFPGFSVGEVKPNRGPGRREVGHANLAHRSLKQVFPDDEIPYTIRIVSDILESNGSSSMATVCGGSLSLLDAGLNIKAPVSGIAMGMISDGKRFAILSDILGDEDHLGDMDFKVTGTEKGICACQMDIKIDGLPYEILEKALHQARDGRLHILNEMNKTISAPREDLKPHAPRMEKITIDRSMIGAVIGPGGKIIQEIQRETGAIVNIEEVGDKGVVTIASANKASLQDALNRVNAIVRVPDVGDEYESVVKSIMPFGLIVAFLPGKTGLVHISEISHSRIDNLEELFKEGDKVKVKMIGVDSRSGKFKLSRKALLPKPPRN